MTVTLAEAVLALLAGAMLLALGRLIRGPSLPDRVVALDLMATTGVAMMAVESLLSRQMATLDAGIVVALVAFLGTVAFAHYLERGGRR
jgi:multicomponent Na+:H+ antiporter subunit F